MTRVHVLTGFPASFLATRVARELVSTRPEIELRCIVPARFREEAERFRGTLAPEAAERLLLLEGDAAAMDLGLSGQEFVALAREVEVIHHCAAVSYLGSNPKAAERVNVGGAREVIELAQEATQLARLVHWSTTAVSGKRRGFVLEEELSDTDGFRNAVEETRFRAERLMRQAAERVPTTVLRPSIMVGDSVSGEIDRFEGPYLLVLLMLSSSSDLRLPIPGRGDIPLNLVPIDFVVSAGCAIASDERSEGKTFHIVDPDPLTVRKVFEVLADAAGRPVPRMLMPTHLAGAILRTPGLERFSHVPRAFLDQLATEVVFDDRNTRTLLAGSGVTCPPFESYVEPLVRYVRAHQSLGEGRKRGAGLEELDPLA